MNMIHHLKGGVAYLNQPAIKASVKNVIGITTIAFGALEIIDLASIHLRPQVKQYPPIQKPDISTTEKVMMVLARTSLITSAITTPQGLKMCGWVAEKIFTEEQLLRYFGPNLNFATTPWHPRHVLSLISFAMGTPAVLRTLYNGVVWLRSSNAYPSNNGKSSGWLTNQKILLMATWDTVTSRPALHGVNYFFRAVLR